MKRTLWLRGATGDSATRLESLRRFLDQDTEVARSTDLVQLLQDKAAAILDKEQAILLPSGTMAQQIALRLHAEGTGRSAFAAHPTTHITNWEKNGYAVVHRLRYHALGDASRLFTERDLRAVSEDLAAVVWELPQREIGGRLPTWDALVAETSCVRSWGAVPHMDGARLWEAQTYYRRPHGEIAGLFDTTYVSLYKSLRAPYGAVLAGSAEFVKRANLWARRLGGDSAANWPLAGFGLQGLAEVLPEMDAYAHRAVELAEAINIAGIAHTVPDVPVTPLFHIYLPISAEDAVRAQDEIITETGTQFFGYVRTTAEPDRCYFEVTVGKPGMQIPPDEVADGLTRMVEIAKRTAKSSRVTV